jgi:hypothetical protein
VYVGRDGSRAAIHVAPQVVRSFELAGGVDSMTCPTSTIPPPGGWEPLALREVASGSARGSAESGLSRHHEQHPYERSRYTMPIRKAWQDTHNLWMNTMVKGSSDALDQLNAEGAKASEVVPAVAKSLLPGAQSIVESLDSHQPKDNYPDGLKTRHTNAKSDADKLVVWLNGRAGASDAMDQSELAAFAGELESLQDNYPGLTNLADVIPANDPIMDNLVAGGFLVRDPNGDLADAEGAGDPWVH